MRFAVTMVNSKGKIHEETIIANNKQEAMWQAQDCNPFSKIIEDMLLIFYISLDGNR